MKIALVLDVVLPVAKYGGTERVVYSLGKALAEMGHEVTFLCSKGSACQFAKIREINPDLPIEDQIPEDVDIIHFNNFVPANLGNRPFVVTFHGNGIPKEMIGPNSIFVSRNHAQRHGCDSWVYNGLDWDLYPKPELNQKRSGFHFLGKAAWRVKNVKGAIDLVKRMPKETLEVLGGNRFNFKMGIRFTFNPRIHFHGLVDDIAKGEFISKSKGLIFPVTWDEPFGLCITESLYFGAPVFATPYGSLPELVTPEVGSLTNDSATMLEYLSEAQSFDPVKCHEYARDNFNAKVMAQEYLKKYEMVLNGIPLVPAPANPLPVDYRHKDWK